MANKIGDLGGTYYREANDFWTYSTVTGGAWAEDIADPVYLVQNTNALTVSMTHFWDSDRGDLVQANIDVLKAPNAYNKAINYWAGNFNLIERYTSYINRSETFNSVISGATYTVPTNYGIVFSYDGLINLYKTRKIKILGYFSSNYGHYFPDLTPEGGYSKLSTPYTVYISEERVDRLVWNILGRMAHLLGDMSVPVHTHETAHPCYMESPGNLYNNGDTYEKWMSSPSGVIDCYTQMPSSFKAQYWTYLHPNVQQGLINVVGTSDPLRYLFYSMNQITSFFPSINVEGTKFRAGNANFFAGDNDNQVIYSDDDYITITDATQYFGTSPQYVDLYQIANATFTYAIRATAGLLYLFASEAGLLRTLTIKNSFKRGFIKYNGTQYRVIGPNGIGFLNPSGNNANIEAIYQDVLDETNGKTYSREFESWSRASSPNQINLNPLQLTISESETYTANMPKLFNINLEAANYIETGSGGSYKYDGQNIGSNYFQKVRSSQRTFEAIPPSGWGFSQWNDGLTTNPRVENVVDHLSLNAIYKKHLASTQSTAFSNNSQRKFVRTTDGTLHLVYESVGRVWYEISTNGGSTWTLSKQRQTS